MRTWLIGALLALVAAGVIVAREGGSRARGVEPTLLPAATATPGPGAAQPVVSAPRAGPTVQPTTAAAARPTPGAPRAATATAVTRGATATAGGATSMHALSGVASATSAANTSVAGVAATSAANTSVTGVAATSAANTSTALAPGGAGSTSAASTAASGATPRPTSLAVGVSPSRAWVALTFDAGADRGYAEDILDTLLNEHILASFGMTGQWARANPDLVRRMAGEGHTVINHSLDHRSFTGVSDGQGGLSATRRRAELIDADAIIAPLIGHTTAPLYRLPYGDDDAHVATDVLPAGYTRKVGWTVDSLGWRGLTASDIVARCLSKVAPGAVYVFHVGRASQDAIALPRLVQALRERGYGFHRADDS